MYWLLAVHFWTDLEVVLSSCDCAIKKDCTKLLSGQEQKLQQPGQPTVSSVFVWDSPQFPALQNTAPKQDCFACPKFNPVEEIFYIISLSFTDPQLLPVGFGANILIFHFMLVALTMCSLAVSHVYSTLTIKMPSLYCSCPFALWSDQSVECNLREQE